MSTTAQRRHCVQAEGEVERTRVSRAGATSAPSSFCTPVHFDRAEGAVERRISGGAPSSELCVAIGDSWHNQSAINEYRDVGGRGFSSCLLAWRSGQARSHLWLMQTCDGETGQLERYGLVYVGWLRRKDEAPVRVAGVPLCVSSQKEHRIRASSA